MCGIAGVLGRTTIDPKNIVERMLTAMIHRGPDQDGIWGAPSGLTTFGHRRLSIIDLSEAGRQPMVDEATGVSLTFNGECYNYLDLRAELMNSGHVFKSKSDTEVILKAYVEWGTNFVSKLRGMFALAIWDPRVRETLIYRDRLGIKPLYYTDLGESFLFASELRAILATEQVSRTLDQDAVASYIWHGFVPGQNTIVKGIKRLDAGTILRIDEFGKVRESISYWKLTPGDRKLSQHDALENAKRELTRATKEHMVSDVPLGVFLSGGVDSSVIAALAQRETATPVTTFNIRFEEAKYDESKYARNVALLLNTEHQELTLTESVFQDQLEDAISGLDQPTFDAINSYFVSRAVRDAGITVALAGTGGDELFGGYSSFRDLSFAKKFTGPLAYAPNAITGAISTLTNWAVSRNCGEVRPQVRWGKFTDLLQAGNNLIGMYQVSYALFSKEMQSNLLLQQSQQTWGLQPSRMQLLSDAIESEEGTLEQISRLEMASFLGERLLPDTDTASMAVSLEVRVPLLDHQFIESLQQLSTAQRYAPLGRKEFLRNTVSDQLNPNIFDRPKAGFELPMEKWCKNLLAPELDATFRDINLAHSVGLDGECVARLWRAFKSGSPGLYWSRLWSIYVLMNWCKKHHVTIG